jgi:hypothetical protein
MMPALAVVMKAIIAATARTISPTPPAKTRAPSESGVNEPASAAGSTRPQVTATAKTDTNSTAAKARNMDRGMFRPGLPISSPMLASLVRPPKLMKTSPVVEKNSRKPLVKNGS